MDIISAKMTLLLTLKCLINERLTAAAEEIFGAIEIILTEYEDETLRSKQRTENQHSPILDDIKLHTAGWHIIYNHYTAIKTSLNTGLKLHPRLV